MAATSLWIELTTDNELDQTSIVFNYSLHCGPYVHTCVCTRMYIPYSSARLCICYVRCLRNSPTNSTNQATNIHTRIYPCRTRHYWQLRSNSALTTYVPFILQLREIRRKFLQMSMRAKLRVAGIPLALLVYYYYSLGVSPLK
jgi:hypothetical protein